ncbi:MAG: hypothetical protein IT308_09265 [Anaerolineaceae bacterium]|nr:hypothetical protein [Anaerolineaceae bacterium]
MPPLTVFPPETPSTGGMGRACLASVFFGMAIVLPLAALAAGWIGWDWKHGAAAGGIVFLVCVLAGGIVLVTIRRPSWAAVFLPMIFGLAYNILPDFLPGGLDDTVAMTLGALLTFLLARKKQPTLSWRALIPLLAAGLFPLIGGFIPGPIDELVVTAVLTVIAWRFGKGETAPPPE